MKRQFKILRKKLFSYLFLFVMIPGLYSCWDGDISRPVDVFPTMPIQKKLILLVHGFGIKIYDFQLGGNPNDMNFYYNWLTTGGRISLTEWQVEKVEGLDSTYNVYSLGGPDDNTKRIESFIKEKTGKSVSEQPDKSIYFIAHSMGGLISRQFSVWHPEKVAKIIMLGTPNGGMNYLGATPPSSSWAGSYHMNGNSWIWPFQQSICWNCMNKAKRGVEHYVFVGTCSGAPGTPGESVPGITGDNDGLVAEWSVRTIEKFKESDDVKIKFYNYRDGHAPGLPIGGGCEADLLNDSRIADKIIDILAGRE
jgi:hypothetical protein